MIAIIQLFAGLFGLVAAGLWFYSAAGSPVQPPSGAFSEAIMPQRDLYQSAVLRIARLNRYAAATTGIAAFLGAASALLGLIH
jgi:hypothetical protein